MVVSMDSSKAVKSAVSKVFEMAESSVFEKAGQSVVWLEFSKAGSLETWKAVETVERWELLQAARTAVYLVF